MNKEQAQAAPLSVLESRTSDQNTDFSLEEGAETTCALFKSIMSKNHVQSIETETTFWQINWCHVYPPEKSAQVCTNDSTRLWMSIKVEDRTGQLNIFMREKAALSLSGTK